MIEDIMECQTIQKAESIWQIIESLVGKITHPELFPKGIVLAVILLIFNTDALTVFGFCYVCSHAGKLTILKTCNSLLRKLSKACNTEVFQSSLRYFFLI
jgi:hypothetical protein